MGCKSVISSETLLIQPYDLALTIQELCTLYGEDLELLELFEAGGEPGQRVVVQIQLLQEGQVLDLRRKLLHVHVPQGQASDPVRLAEPRHYVRHPTQGHTLYVTLLNVFTTEKASGKVVDLDIL